MLGSPSCDLCRGAWVPVTSLEVLKVFCGLRSGTGAEMPKGDAAVTARADASRYKEFIVLKRWAPLMKSLHCLFQVPGC